MPALIKSLLLGLLLFMPLAPASAQPASPQPDGWLEEVEGEKALTWVRAQNARSLGVLEADPRNAAYRADALAILEATDRVPMPTLRKGEVFNFWQDKTNVRGLWRRTSLDSYRSAAPKWDVLLDVDALSAAEKANWVFKGSHCRWPDYGRCLISLSDGGKDAVQVREFDLSSKAFVAGGFALPQGKQDVAWAGKDTLLVAREWGPDTMTESGYAFIVKQLERGQPLDQAKELFRGVKTDVGVSPLVLHDGDGNSLTLFVRNITFYEAETWVHTAKGAVKLALPAKHSVAGLLKNQLLVTLQEDWTTPSGVFKSGALISIDAAAARAAPAALQARLVLAPGPRQSIEGVSTTRNYVLIDLYENVRGGVRRMALTDKGWTGEAIPLPDNASIGVVAAEDESDDVFISVASFLTPSTLWFVDAKAGKGQQAKANPPRFNASTHATEQFTVRSKDGTEIPYFVVRPKEMKLDGANPTLLYAYGGFQVSMTPSYSGATGKLWLEKGGVYVLANIRGGGEFGPAWHQAGLKTQRQRIYDDFAAVAEDLIARKITSPRRLGIMGGSNGGLLMGVQLTQRPELWNAVVVQVPLLDMLRYHTLLAGASWMAEYGDPDAPQERAFLQSISPYHNVRPGVAYPEPLFVTSTKDDRVHPGHARKMAHRFEQLGLPFLYYENIDGGHSAAANLQEAAKRVSLEYTYLARKLMD
jgi:prolyl oligopeptidase